MRRLQKLNPKKVPVDVELEVRDSLDINLGFYKINDLIYIKGNVYRVVKAN